MNKLDFSLETILEQCCIMKRSSFSPQSQWNESITFKVLSTQAGSFILNTVKSRRQVITFRLYNIQITFIAPELLKLKFCFCPCIGISIFLCVFKDK